MERPVQNCENIDRAGGQAGASVSADNEICVLLAETAVVSNVPRSGPNVGTIACPSTVVPLRV